MTGLFNILLLIVKAIAFIVFISGVVFAILGGIDFIHAFSYIGTGEPRVVGFIAIALLRSIDLFLIGLVCFVFSLGILVLFYNKEGSEFPPGLPRWLRIKEFIQLKVILWEAILTTLVVSYLAGLAERRLNGESLSVSDLIIPGAILLIAVSLYFLKKGESHGP